MVFPAERQPRPRERPHPERRIRVKACEFPDIHNDLVRNPPCPQRPRETGEDDRRAGEGLPFREMSHPPDQFGSRQGHDGHGPHADPVRPVPVFRRKAAGEFAIEDAGDNEDIKQEGRRPETPRGEQENITVAAGGIRQPQAQQGDGGCADGDQQRRAVDRILDIGILPRHQIEEDVIGKHKPGENPKAPETPGKGDGIVKDKELRPKRIVADDKGEVGPAAARRVDIGDEIPRKQGQPGKGRGGEDRVQQDVNYE